MNRVYNGDRRGVDAVYSKLFEENPDDPVLTSAVGGYFYYYRNYDAARRAFKRYMQFPAERRNARRTTVIQSRLRTLR